MTTEEAEALIRAGQSVQQILTDVAEADRAVAAFQTILDAGTAKDGLYEVQIPGPVNEAPIRIRIPLSDFKSLVAAAASAAESALASLSITDAVDAEK